MSMTAFQREGLERLGYTKRESEFLFLVATHSGYFTNRQFKAFAQTDSGSVSHAFIRKLLEREHASYHAYRSGGRVYHLFARKVYQAIERENLRTRKKHELQYVKTRLVALDFVLKHPQHEYLETEADKVSFFEKQRNVSRDALPVKLYRARKTAEVTPRYFVDRFPMFMIPTSASRSVSFTYIDSEAVTLNAFGTHLRSYTRLFETLPRFEFLYLAPSARLFDAAESAFRRLFGGRQDYSRSVSVLAYFELRKAWDSKERVASADVVLLKEAQRQYVGKNFDELYERWRSGSLPDSELPKTFEGLPRVNNVTFRTLICGSSLSVFTDPKRNDAENCLDTDSSRRETQDSSHSSVQVLGS